MEKYVLARAIRIQKENWGTPHFSEIIELKFEKKLPYILCILKLFWNYSCLIVSKTFQKPLLRSAFSAKS